MEICINILYNQYCNNVLLLRGIKTPTQYLITDKKSPTTGWRAVNILNKPAILCYSFDPPTTDISGGFYLIKRGTV